MPAYRGLTWDHPRGRVALEEAAQRQATQESGLSLTWDVHSLEGFESAPIDSLAAEYDLIVLDHPHLGEAREHASLQAIDDHFSTAQLAEWARDSVGPSMESYRWDGRLWALPLDAATQVAVRRPDLVDDSPETWQDVVELSRRQPVALSLAGPHALLSLCSISVAMGHEPGADPEQFLNPTAGREAIEMMSVLAARAPAHSATWNPIELLDAMSNGADIAYCPLVYGYVNYASRTRHVALAFSDAPVMERGGRPGSVIGGTGIAISRKCVVTDELRDHISWLMSPETQSTFIPAHQGQPRARSAWRSSRVNADVNNFYRDTLATIETAWVRPRYAGYVAFQTEASALVRDAIAGELSASEALVVINRMHESRASTTGTEREASA